MIVIIGARECDATLFLYYTFIHIQQDPQSVLVSASTIMGLC